MKRLILTGLILSLSAFLHPEGARRFTVSADMLTDLTQSEIIAYILNESFDDLWRDKADLGEENFLGRRYTLFDLHDTEKKEDNENALNSNWDDLWASTADVGT